MTTVLKSFVCSDKAEKMAKLLKCRHEVHITKKSPTYIFMLFRALFKVINIY